MKKYLLAFLAFFASAAHADTQLYPCFTTTANLLTCLISNYSIVWPLHQGGNGSTLVNDGSGNLVWGTPSGASIGTGLADGNVGSILYVGSGPVLAQNTSFVFDGGNLGIATAAPAARLDVAGAFQVNSLGNIIEIRSVPTSFPSTQGAANTVLKNDGAGNLAWYLSDTAATASSLVARDGSGILAGTLNGSATNVTGVVAVTHMAGPAASGTSGYLGSGDWVTFNDKVATSETINTTAPLQGGGDLSAPRTFSITQAGAIGDGYLSSTDWNIFNTKVTSVSGTAPIVSSGGATPAISMHVAGSSFDGYLSSSDWSEFSAKQDGISATAPVTFSANTVGVTQAATAANGYLSSTDWNTFNVKQAAGGYITSLTADVTAAGPGAAAATVTALQSRPVSASAPAANDVLQWIGSAWTPNALSGLTVGNVVSGGVSRGVLYVDAFGKLGEDATAFAWDQERRFVSAAGSATGSKQYEIVGSYDDTSNGGVYVSTDNGVTYSRKTTTNGLGSNFILSVFAEGPRFYAGTLASGLSISSDAGQTWTTKTTSDGLPDNQINCIYALGNTIYVGTQAGLAISTDNGTTWTTKTTSDGLANNSIADLTVSNGSVYAGSDGGMSISTNGGASFVVKTAADGLPSTSVYHIHVIGDRIYAGTVGTTGGCAGVGLSTNGGTSFSILYQVSCGTNINGLAVANNNIYATQSNGLLASSINGASWTTQSVSGASSSLQDVKAYPYGNTVAVYFAAYGNSKIAISLDAGSTWNTYAGVGDHPVKIDIFKGTDVADVDGNQAFAGISYRWPTGTQGAANTSMSNNGSGVLSWKSTPNTCSRQTNTCNTNTTCTVTCSGGSEKVTGGGCNSTVAVTASYPSADNAWKCDEALTGDITAYAICCSM